MNEVGTCSVSNYPHVKDIHLGCVGWKKLVPIQIPIPGVTARPNGWDNRHWHHESWLMRVDDFSPSIRQRFVDGQWIDV